MTLLEKKLVARRKLTERQIAYLEHIANCAERDGKLPRLTEIAREMNVKKASANDVLNSLVAGGYLIKLPAHFRLTRKARLSVRA